MARSAKGVCKDCGGPAFGFRCLKCEKKARRDAMKRCGVCRRNVDRRNPTGVCRDCQRGVLKSTLTEEATKAPPVPPVPRVSDVDCIVLTDTHIPYHRTDVILKACEAAQLLGIGHLIVAGDLIHADVLSRFDSIGRAPSAYEELESAGKIVHALLEIFDKITIIPGNHDQRWEKAFSRMKGHEAQAAMEVIARLTEAEDMTPGSLALGVLRRALSSDRVVVHPLPELVVADTWRIMHPGSCSRVAGTTERKMAGKWLQHVIGGHNHLAGYQFHESAQYIAANIGHACDTSKFRYVREKPTTFPRMVPGFCAIVSDEDAPNGRLIPLVVHEAWMDLGHLAKRLAANG